MPTSVFSWVILYVSISMCLDVTAWGSTAKHNLDPKHFPVDGLVARQASFWEEIFLTFPNTTSVVHDTDFPDIIIDIIDHISLSRRQGTGTARPNNKERQELNKKYVERYALGLQRFAKSGKKALAFGAIEQRIYSVYNKSSFDLQRLMSGQVQIRTQSGLANNFIEAAHRAQDFLGYMENQFSSFGVPEVITRLAFVESMFNTDAKSKVGASGMWQFMPGTAKIFMTVNQFVDERNNPYKASRGAAQLLAMNYRDLQQWPLAITAYNHGLAGMKRGIRETGSNRLEDIIRNYQSRTFGFASKNFYAEFIAAARSYQRIVDENIIAPRPMTIDLTTIKLNQKLSAHQLINKTPLDLESLKQYNSCLDEKIFGRYKDKPLPKSFELVLPVTMADKVKLALSELDEKSMASK